MSRMWQTLNTTHPSAGPPTWSPPDTAGLLQWTLDGTGYAPAKINHVPILQDRSSPDYPTTIQATGLMSATNNSYATSIASSDFGSPFPMVMSLFATSKTTGIQNLLFACSSVEVGDTYGIALNARNIRIDRRNGALSVQDQTTAPPSPVDTLSHYLIVFIDESTVDTYVDGEHFQLLNLAAVPINSTYDSVAINTLRVLSPTTAAAEPNGEFQIYKNFLPTADQVREIANGLTPVVPYRYYPACEGGGGTLHDVIDQAHATINAPQASSWTTKQELYDYGILRGGRFDTGAFIPKMLTSNDAADGGAAPVGPNQVSPLSLIDIDPFADLPVGINNGNPFALASNPSSSTPVNAKFVRGSAALGRDRWLTYGATLTGDDLANATDYTTA